jgi:hypothetical protein
LQAWLNFLKDENKNITAENEQLKEIVMQKGFSIRDIVRK